MEVDGFSSRLKRKEFEDVADDFSDFSLTSPATKIRRLDAELPPIIEEGGCNFSVEFEQSVPYEQTFGGNSSGGLRIEEIPNDCNSGSTGGIRIEELPNEERAIVLFNPINNASVPHSPSNFSVNLNPHIISGFKNQLLWSGQANSWRVVEDEQADNEKTGSDNGCLAVVPWVPSQFSTVEFPQTDNYEMMDPQTDNYEMMDAQESGEAAMDVEDISDLNQNRVSEAAGMSSNEQHQQWQPQQQHCLIPELPLNSTTPIVWYR